MRSHTHARACTSRYRFEKFGNIFRRVIDAWVQNARSIRRKKRVTATYFENTQISNFARIYFFIPLFKKTNKKKFCDEGWLKKRREMKCLNFFEFESWDLVVLWCGSRACPGYLSSQTNRGGSEFANLKKKFSLFQLVVASKYGNKQARGASRDYQRIPLIDTNKRTFSLPFSLR